MQEAAPEPFGIHLPFDDFDLLASSARGWDLEFMQLQKGRFHGELFQVGTEQVQLGRAEFNLHLSQRGNTPEGLRTIVIPANDAQRFIWRGRELSGSQLAVYPAGSEIDLTSWKGFDAFALSVSEDRLAELGRWLEVPDVSSLLDDAQIVDVRPADMRRLQRRLQRACREFVSGHTALSSASKRDELEWHLPSKVLKTLMLSRSTDLKLAARQRDQALDGALDLLSSCSEEPLSVADVCREVAVSERTLQYAFQERFGVTPKVYFQAYRLNGVRRMLMESEAGVTKVSDVANMWGFWHLGQFAADYRRLFGELPSHTLERPN